MLLIHLAGKRIVVIGNDVNFFITAFIKVSLAFIRYTSFLTHFMLVKIFIFVSSEVQIPLVTNFEVVLIKKL